QLKAELEAMPQPTSLPELLAYHSKMAQAMFKVYGSHVPVLYLYDREFKMIDTVSTAFSDQSDKYLFWRDAADRAAYLKAFTMVWTSEAWLRDIKEHQGRPMRDLPVVGEQLHLVVADAKGVHKVIAWNIVRLADTASPTLELVKPDDARRPGPVFFIKPVVDAMRAVHA
ncbi:hypothetical protein, partial [Variovorax boronicumulans]|uniref:hypothetical protein n=1 Tax=Variovorax boronicumulans TaxID=436515 RepID=UPI003F5CD09E